MEKYRHTRRAITAAAAAVTIVAGAGMAVQASEVQRAYAQHTSTCIGLFFSDRQAHAAQCLPNRHAAPTIITSSGGAAPVVVAPPPAPPPPVVVPPVVVVEPPPPPECELVPGNCGPVCQQMV